MPLNIKDGPTRKSGSKAAKLRRPVSGETAADDMLAKIRDLQRRYAALPVLDPRTEWEILDDLYDEHGLPK